MRNIDVLRASAADMIKLDDDDQGALLGLGRNASPDAIRGALEAIAMKHGGDWADWPTWQIGELTSYSIIGWASEEHDSKLLPGLIGLAFEHCLPRAASQEDIRRLFDQFSDALTSLAVAENGPRGGSGQARDLARDSIAAMIEAVGPAGARLAIAALSFATVDRFREWISHAWQKAQTSFDAAALGQASREPASGRAGGRRPDDGSGLR